jgi:hypothetical protein
MVIDIPPNNIVTANWDLIKVPNAFGGTIGIGFYSGIVAFDFTGADSWRYEDIRFVLLSGAPNDIFWRRVNSVMPIVPLSSIYNEQQQTNSGWAVDAVNWDVVNDRVRLTCRVAVRGTNVHLYRLAYKATVLGDGDFVVP